MSAPTPSARSAAREWVRRLWRDEAGATGRIVSLLLLPAELLFRGIVHLRNAAYGRRILTVREPPVPVLSVGNLTVGGTGKTPVVGWVARELEVRGLRPAIVASGYGEDELLLHRRWNPDIALHADPDRVRGVEEAAGKGAGVVILDDGFQHRRLGRSADWVLLSAEQPRLARLLPRGAYREPASSLRRATLLLVTRKEAPASRVSATAAWARRHAPGVPLVHLRLEPSGWSDLLGRTTPPPGDASLAVAGIGEPETLPASARAAGCPDLPLLAFPDHHAYTVADAARIRREAGGGSVVTTEKDAVRLAPLADALPEVRVLRLHVVVTDGSEHLDAALTGLAGRATGGTP